MPLFAPFWFAIFPSSLANTRGERCSRTPVLTYPSSLKEEHETDSRLQAAAATETGETATTTAEDCSVAEAAMAIEAGSLRRDMRLDHGLRKVMHSISLAVTSLPACQPTL